MPESPVKNHPIAEAARYNDAQMDEGKPLPGLLAELGLTLGDIRYIAAQRAIRVVAVISQRRELKVLLGEKGGFETIPPLTAAEKIAFRAANLAALDGLVAGWRGRMIAERQNV